MQGHGGRGRAWEPALREASSRAAEIEDARCLPEDLVERLAGTGLFRLWVASTCGGPELDVQTGLDAIEEASYHDGSTGWCVMIANTTALMSGKLPPHHALDIFGFERAVAGGFAVPHGTATPCEGGLRVTGDWAWGSGSGHCTAFGGGVRLADDASTSPAGSSKALFAFFDLEDVEFLDTWHVAGLKGTASTDYRVDGAFVPTGRWVALEQRQVVVDTPLFNFPTLGALALGVAMVGVGLARRAVDELVELADKVPQGSSRSLGERAGTQSDLASAEAAVRSSRAFVADTVGETWDVIERTGQASDEHKRLLRMAAEYATRTCAGAVDLCFHAAGGTAVYLESPLQRVFRDMHVATQHAMVAARVREPLGRMRFGLPTDARML